MTLIEAQNRSATVVADSPTVLYELAARNLYTYYKADIYAYVMCKILTASSVGGSAAPTIALPSWQTRAAFGAFDSCVSPTSAKICRLTQQTS